MPIKRMLDSYKFGDGLPCIAKIRKGAPKPTQEDGKPVQRGHKLQDLDYFRVVLQPGYEAQRAIVEHLFTEQPKFFYPVRFLGATMDQVFNFWLEEHAASKMLKRCDGETIHQWFDQETGEYHHDAALACDPAKCECKPHGELRFSLPSLNRELGVPGYVILYTTSWNDIRSIMSCFKDFETMGYTDLREIEFVIGRAPRSISTPVPKPKDPSAAKDWSPGDRAKRTKSMIFIRPSKDFTKLVMMGSGDQPARPALPAPTSRIGNLQPPPAPRRIGAPSAEVVKYEPPEDDEWDDDEEDADWVEVQMHEPDMPDTGESDSDEETGGYTSVTVGNLDMVALLYRASNAQLVDNKYHFNNLVRLLLAEKTISDKSSADQVLDAMRKHKAAKELEGAS